MLKVEELKNKQIILFGSGGMGDSFFVRVQSKYNFNIIAVVDDSWKNDSDGEFHGVRLINPKNLSSIDVDKDSVVVIVAVMNRDFYKDINAKLFCAGFKNVFAMVDLYELQLLNEPEGFWNEDYFSINEQNINKVRDMLCDEKSKAVYDCFVDTHKQKKYIEFKHDSLSEQYFPKDVTLKKHSKAIHCGAYTGENVEQFGSLNTLCCFEPSIENYKELVKRDFSNVKEKYLFPCGVYSDNKVVRFNNHRANAAVCDKGDGFAVCVKLDDAIGFVPDYITIDIEGAEIEALHGAKETISKYTPDLAVCVYHSPDHIWKIPLMLNEMNKNYKFYIRVYSYFTNETVLYATQG